MNGKLFLFPSTDNYGVPFVWNTERQWQRSENENVKCKKSAVERTGKIKLKSFSIVFFVKLSCSFVGHRGKE